MTRMNMKSALFLLLAGLCVVAWANEADKDETSLVSTCFSSGVAKFCIRWMAKFGIRWVAKFGIRWMAKFGIRWVAMFGISWMAKFGMRWVAIRS